MVTAQRYVSSLVRKGSQTVLILLLWINILAVDVASAEESWKAGVARVDITPTEPIWMAGYAARKRPSEGVRHPIHAKALALEDEQGTISVLVTADLGGFRREVAEPIAARASDEYGLPRERLVLNASHTHSGPITRVRRRPSYPLKPEHIEVINRYQKRLIDQVVGLIGDAMGDRQPATLSYEQGLAGFAVNRRRVRRREYPSPTDHDVPVLAVRKADGSLLAVAFGYACHATVLGDYEINGDWPGFAQSAVEDRNPGQRDLLVGRTQGSAQRPHLALEHQVDRDGQRVAVALCQLDLASRQRILVGAAAVHEQRNNAFKVPTKAELDARLSDENRRKREHAKRMLAILSEEGKLMESYLYPVQVWQFGDGLTFIALAGEVVVDYSLRFKGAYGWHDTWVSAYNNDVFGYVPSLRVLKEGGYEGGGAMLFTSLPGPFRAGVEETIAETVDELVARTGGK